MSTDVIIFIVIMLVPFLLFIVLRGVIFINNIVSIVSKDLEVNTLKKLDTTGSFVSKKFDEKQGPFI